MNKPVIGITTPKRFFQLAYHFIRLSIWISGGKPVALRDISQLETTHIDGLILGGGTDVYPGLYQTDQKQNYVYDRPRDEMEMAWLKKAEQNNIPILGICRGAQMINVVHGGSLHLDIALAYEDAHYPKALWRQLFYRKSIFLDEPSLLSDLTKKTQMRVNSMHTQSVDRLGNGLKISARESNGIVQAIEHKTPHIFYLGVQFHPEFLIYRGDMRALFKGFIKSAAECRKNQKK